MWDLPGPGLDPMSPALASGFLTTVPPGKPCVVFSFVDLPQFVHFTVDRHLSSLQFEAISNSAAMKIFVHVKYVCIFVGYLPRHGMSG